MVPFSCASVDTFVSSWKQDRLISVGAELLQEAADAVTSLCRLPPPPHLSRVPGGAQRRLSRCAVAALICSFHDKLFLVSASYQEPVILRKR